jgi:hypothetical protein
MISKSYLAFIKTSDLENCGMREKNIIIVYV